MKKESSGYGIDLYAIGAEICRASRFEEMYYEMEKDRDFWKDKYWDMMNQSEKHNKEMIGSLLEFAMKTGE